MDSLAVLAASTSKGSRDLFIGPKQQRKGMPALSFVELLMGRFWTSLACTYSSCPLFPSVCFCASRKGKLWEMDFESVPILLNFMISFLWEANSSSFRYHDDDEAVAGNQSSISSNFCNGPVPHVRLSLCCLCWASIYSETVWAQPSLRTYVVP